MSLAPGVRLGPYEVLALVGVGGMGDVYRARDTKLGRDVALKVLPDHFADDPDRLARFQREAQVLASLNHPNIAAIYGLEETEADPSTGSGQAAVRALVLEFVDGPTLADVIARRDVGRGLSAPPHEPGPKGPGLPLDEALPIARQIADALEAAHEHGVFHRDLKPANIILQGAWGPTPTSARSEARGLAPRAGRVHSADDVVVKVLDFGLAKVREALATEAALTNSPTMLAASMPGMILGTAAYMSPEQAKGKEADRTADVWAFGCVLYEMLTGRPVFEGDTVGEILAGVLKGEPDWSRLPAGTPESIRRLLRRCLQKERKLRLHDMADVRIEIDEAPSEPQTDARVVQSRPRRGERLAWMSAVALLTLMAAAAVVWAFRPVPPAPERRLEINTPPTTDPVSLAISPDGLKIVFAATSEGRSRLWLRSLDSVSARPLAGTDSARLPFWSPDSRSVGFFADGKLKRIEIVGGSAQELANAEFGVGGAWSNDGVILFSPRPGSPISHIPAAGGEPAPVTRLERPQQGHYSPAFLPDGRHFLYFVLGSPEARGVYVGQLDGSETRRLLDTDAPAVYASSGHLLFVHQGMLFAQTFDPVRLEPTGDPFPVAERVTVGSGLPFVALSASAAGPLAYRSGSAGPTTQLVWFDRSGKEMGKVESPDSAGAFCPSLSRDGGRVALSRGANADVWVLELERNRVSKFTTDAATDMCPIWSPDGRRIVFSSGRKGVLDLYQKPASGAGSEEPLLTTAQVKFATDWSTDGRFLLYASLDPKMKSDIWALPLDANGKPGKPSAVVQTSFDEENAQFSPDGKWIAFQSNESGRFEIYVQPFPGSGGKSVISTTGGVQPRWRRDGKELFYIALDNRLMAVPIQLASNGQAVEPGAPVSLFPTRIGDPVQAELYMVSSNGQRFLLNTVTEATSPITVILNWKAKP